MGVIDRFDFNVLNMEEELPQSLYILTSSDPQ